jgi:2-dehydro-3-deoxygluconokinase
MSYAEPDGGTAADLRPGGGHLDLLAVGETMAMVAPVDGGRLDEIATLRLTPAGAESNVAAMLSRLGRRTAWASRLGADPLGDLVLAGVAAHGVDVRLVERDVQRPTGVYFKDPSPSGTRVYYYRAGSAASALGPADLAAWIGARPAIVHVSAITAAISDTGAALLERVVLGRAFGAALVSFDVNYRPALWAPARAAALTRELAQASDLVFAGRDEGEILWGCRTAEELRRLLDRPMHLLVKDGPAEAVAFGPEGVVRCAPAPREVVDPVGAGDAFAAGWLAGHLLGLQAYERLRLAHWVAGRVLGSSSDLADVPPAEVVVDLLDRRRGLETP